jgi:hypothetical protein
MCLDWASAVLIRPMLRPVMAVSQHLVLHRGAPAKVMAHAHGAWRQSLRGVTIAELAGQVPEAVREKIRAEFGSSAPATTQDTARETGKSGRVSGHGRRLQP